MKFGFLAHPTTTGQRHLVHAAALVTDLVGRRPGWPEPERQRGSLPVPLLRSLTSPTGAHCTGDVRYLPYTADQMLRQHGAAADHVVEEIRKLAKDGAQIVGLGGASSIVGDRGLWTAEQVGNVFLTSGNSLTSHSAHELVRHVVGLLGRSPEQTRVTVIGYPGSIGLVVTKLLLDDGHLVDVVHRRSASNLDSLVRYLSEEQRERVRFLSDVSMSYPRSRIFVAASSSGGIIDTDRLLPGSVVIDVALPRDVAEPPRGRRDVLVLDGGMVSAPGGLFATEGPLPAPTRQLNGCLAETIVLALEERAEHWSLGRELDPDRVREIGVLARRQGFSALPAASFGRLVSDRQIEQLAGYHGDGSTGSGAAGHHTGRDVRQETTERFRRYVNPPMADFMRGHGIDHVFSSARGATLTTPEGVDYLDFVAGYGCLNLGHNPPAVVDRLRGFLDSGAPSFVQYVSMPVHTAELAERLCEIAPGQLGRVFFSNSGTEAVEAALKVARAATGRKRLVYVENSYHGKTLGALSVTGRATHRDPFGPLLPDCVAVRFGDEQALADALDGAAAFIVEPVLGEGGVVLPPTGYLRRAQELCRRAGAVFVLDEIQTGLGRTGKMFAAEHDGLEPDVICLAKSLSGGLVPIGATLMRAELWDAAYGSPDRCAQHSSTFGGGNFAAVAGLATLDSLAYFDIPARAERIGRLLRERLAEVCAPYSFVREVRGIGMMNAIAFDADMSGAGLALADDLLTRLPGELHEVAAWLPVDARRALAQTASALEGMLGDLLCLRVVRGLAEQHRILTYVTANRSRVLRIQPPLILTESEAERFVGAVGAVAADLSFFADLAAARA
ncbi:aminotransferase class III-fold pyridoxal phosphate-dependent enzyme [Micromonospora echinofusca]|uniref:Aminotransferase class III-fold pyridoxal phosphate-dependent enzyme n=1 Tax=Micromonospora echinofusca TaxID=47858 RepID=A0ABS3VPZ6_MICEH|nr:aminotransferase class III-fold pyridoxal phosphate-dependent enzyme [Micromonospora echinofusca]MBO4206619.1 aminotransferase class III-fold pyridoxal phosphate-dependent enzyme [Micromonospora echinofusca]